MSDFQSAATTWDDGSGTFGTRWTLTTSSAAVVSAILAVLIAFAINRLATFANSLIFLFFLHKHTKTLFDDQINTLALNRSPIGLLASLVLLCRRIGRSTLASTAVWVGTTIAVTVLALQGLAIYGIGNLFSNTTVPLISGQCGYPNWQFNYSKYDLAAWNDDTIRNLTSGLVYLSTMSDQSVRRLSSCTDFGKNVTCPGPLDGRNFTWEVFESEPGYCWFGGENCYTSPKAKTILQRATISVKDMGTTLQNPRIAVTFSTECSHLNVTNRVKMALIGGQMYTLYDFGTVNVSYIEAVQNLTIDNPDLRQSEEATFIVTDAESLGGDGYKILYQRYPLDESIPPVWTPADFILSKLNSSSFVDPKGAYPQTLDLIANRLVSVYSRNQNDDPLYLTASQPLLIRNVQLYAPGTALAVVACREHVQVHVRSKESPFESQAYSPDDVKAVGRDLGHAWENFNEYVKTLDPSSVPRLKDELAVFVAASKYTNIGTTIESLTQGNKLSGASTLLGNLQVGNPESLTTRMEVIRWFGILVMNVLYLAQTYTSSENDWGYSPLSIPTFSESDVEHWICYSTLRSSSAYTSINLKGLALIAVLCFLIISLSFSLQRLLSFLVKRMKSPRPEICKSLIAISLHDTIQLHRIAVEKTYHVRFRRTTGLFPLADESFSNAPIYGVIAIPDAKDTSPPSRGGTTMSTATSISDASISSEPTVKPSSQPENERDTPEVGPSEDKSRDAEESFPKVSSETDVASMEGPNPVAQSTSRAPSSSSPSESTKPKEPEGEETSPQLKLEDKRSDDDNEQQQLKEQLFATMLGFEEVERSESLNLRFLKEVRA